MANKRTLNQVKSGKSQKQLLKEIDDALLHKPHRSLTAKCLHCSEPHTTSQHLSHGIGSYNRTHGDSTFRLLKDLSVHGAEDLAHLLDKPRRKRRKA